MAEAVPDETIRSLEATAREIRRDIVRMTQAAGSGHPGGSLSVADLLTALVFQELRVDRNKLPVIEASTGCLGQGIGMAVGMALGARLAHNPSRTFAIIGDGECQAGPTWEALMAGGHYRLDNLVVILDRNGYETDGSTESIMGIEPIADKFRAFRYHTLEIDGHDYRAILEAFAEARRTGDQPTAIVAHTIKGKGVSFMEGTHVYHGKPPSSAELERALAELGIPGGER